MELADIDNANSYTSLKELYNDHHETICQNSIARVLTVGDSRALTACICSKLDLDYNDYLEFSVLVNSQSVMNNISSSNVLINLIAESYIAMFYIKESAVGLWAICKSSYFTEKTFGYLSNYRESIINVIENGLDYFTVQVKTLHTATYERSGEYETFNVGNNFIIPYRAEAGGEYNDSDYPNCKIKFRNINPSIDISDEFSPTCVGEEAEFDISAKNIISARGIEIYIEANGGSDNYDEEYDEYYGNAWVKVRIYTAKNI